jgi:hypothetical protein
MRQAFVVTYLPFSESDLELQTIEYGKDDQEAQKEFEMHHPGLRVKEVKAK